MGKKDKAIAMVIDNLSGTEAGELIGEIAKAKQKVAPEARTTGGMTSRDNIGNMLQEGWKKVKKALPGNKN